jgi:hypothetical protein
MMFQEIIVVVEINCPGQNPIIERIDVMQIAGHFDRGMVKTTVQNNHPGCNVNIIDVEWVIEKSF